MLFRLKVLLLLASAAALGFCGWLLWFALSPIELAAPTVEFSIRPGSTLRGATRQIIDAGLSMPGWKFILLARANGASAGVKAGSYQVSDGVTPLRLVRKITRGEYAQAEILLVEGWNFRQVREALNAHADLKHDSAKIPAFDEENFRLRVFPTRDLANELERRHPIRHLVAAGLDAGAGAVRPREENELPFRHG